MLTLLSLILKLFLVLTFWVAVLWTSYYLAMGLVGLIAGLLLFLSQEALRAAGDYFFAQCSAGTDQRASGAEQQREKVSVSCPFTVLGLKRGASRAEVQNAYRERIKLNHPDRVSELDPEIQAFATERAKLITNAYQEALRGMR